jgi:transcription initiation factor TFIIE subunit alpha
MVSVEDPKVRRYVEETVGPEGMRLVQALGSKEEATDSQLAEELGEKPSHIRKILYDLYEARIAEYHKVKDKETGWLTFYWRITPGQAQYALNQKRLRELAKLQEKLRFEQEHDFFICPSGMERFDFVAATEQSFHCPEHGEVLQAHDNAQEINKIRQKIQELLEAAES